MEGLLVKKALRYRFMGQRGGAIDFHFNFSFEGVADGNKKATIISSLVV
jgi:hypothetical protein